MTPLRATCSAYGLSGNSSEYKIIVQVFLYKYLNDKFGYEVKRADTDYRDKLRNAEHWEDAYKELTDDEREDLQDFVPEAPRMKTAAPFTARTRARRAPQCCG